MLDVGNGLDVPLADCEADRVTDPVTEAVVVSELVIDDDCD